MNITEKSWGSCNSQSVSLYTMMSDNGLSVSITNYGGIITSILASDSKGIEKEITLGFDSLQEYLSESYQQAMPFFGAIIGRVANRIADAQFSLNGKTYTLDANNGNHCLHGGKKGFHTKVWDAKTSQDDKAMHLTLHAESSDGEGGFPGNLAISVIYTLSNQNELIIEYVATSDTTTPINLTNHAYFNLSGGSENVENHVLYIDADSYTEVTDEGIPTGKIVAVMDTPMDFRQGKRIGERIHEVQGNGYDHNYVLNNPSGALQFCAEVFSPLTNIRMKMYTTEKCVQFYSGNFLDGRLARGEVRMEKRGGFCLEAQKYPDSVHHLSFPSTLVNAGETYTQKTEYRFIL